MPDISNPQLTAFCNQRVRPLANQLRALKIAMDDFIAQYTSDTIAATITAAGGSNNVADGSDLDGRPRITGNQVVNFRAAVIQMQTALSTTLVSGVGATVEAITDGIRTP